MVKVRVERILACKPMFYWWSTSCNILLRKGTTHQDDKFHKALAAHQGADCETFSPDQFASPSSKGPADDLARKCNTNNPDNICPCNAIIEQAKIGAQAGICKIQGEEEGCNKILNLLSNMNGEATIVGTYQASKEGYVALLALQFSRFM
jgi:hypothetical protein